MSIQHRVCREQVPRDEHMETHAANLHEAHGVAFGWLGICGSRLRWESGRRALNKSESCTRWLEQFAAQLRE